MDDTDKKIIFALERDASRRIDQLAKYLGIPRSTLHNRIKKLEKKKVIKGYKAVINYDKLDLELTAIIQIMLAEKAQIGDVVKQLSLNPRIEAIFTVTGRPDIIVKARFKNAREIGSFNYDQKHESIRSVPGISRTETAVVLHTVKEYYEVQNDELEWYTRPAKRTRTIKKT
jgi:Lrp/AsnC family transcriptional regulator, regulator for asnA, asnC and gidA